MRKAKTEGMDEYEIIEMETDSLRFYGTDPDAAVYRRTRIQSCCHRQNAGNRR